MQGSLWALVGTDIDRLVSFTHYSRKFVEAVSTRMHECGRWVGNRARTDHWMKDGMVTWNLWLDCMIADGTVELLRTPDGEEYVRAIA
jgi:hypothetical protein